MAQANREDKLEDYSPYLVKPRTWEELVPQDELGLYGQGGTTSPIARDLRSSSFISGERGWRLSSSGLVEATGINITNVFKTVAEGENIQDAIDTVNTQGGGTIRLAATTFTPTYDIVLYDGIALVGASTGNTVIDFNSTSYQIKVVGSDNYSTGTVSVNLGSTTVTGSGTTWTSAMAGLGILLGGFIYTIASVTNATELELATSFGSANLSGASYVIADFVEETRIQDITVKGSTDTSAVKVQYASEFYIENVLLQTSPIGLEIDDTAQVTVNNIDTQFNNSGVELTNTHYVLFSGAGSIGAQVGNGVTLNNVTNSAFSSCFFSANAADGVNLTDCDNIQFSGVSCTYNTGQGFELVSGNTDISMSGVGAEGNGSDGIKLTATSDRTHIIASALSSNGGYGINIADNTSDDTTIASCSFPSNTSGDVDDNGTDTIWDTDYFTANTDTDVSGNSWVIDEDNMASDLDTKVPTQQSVKAYVDSQAGGMQFVQFKVFDFATNTATGDGKYYFHVPSDLNGTDIDEVHAEVITAGTTNTTDIQIHNINHKQNEYSMDLESSSSQYALITDGDQTGLDITGDLTAELWVRFETVQDCFLVNKWGVAGNLSWVLNYINSTNKLSFTASSNGTASTTKDVSWTPSAATWYHVAAVYDASAGEVAFYVNGSQQGTTQTGLPTSLFNSNQPFVIGINYNGGTTNNPFDGLIDDVRIWSEERTATQISANYNQNLVGNETNLEGLWRLENDLTDTTSNGNDLTGGNSPTFSTTTPDIYGADILSTKLTIDSGETGSDTAATAAVIDTDYDDVSTNDLLRIDVDQVSSTPAKGLLVTIGFN